MFFLGSGRRWVESEASRPLNKDVKIDITIHEQE
jgi:hypothetical protein